MGIWPSKIGHGSRESEHQSEMNDGQVTAKPTDVCRPQRTIVDFQGYGPNLDGRY